jgi:enterobacteria phage integrase
LRCSVPNTGIAPSPGLSRERIITGILQPYADRPGAALDILKKLRILIRHAINVGWLKHDPSLGIKRPKIKKNSVMD